MEMEIQSKETSKICEALSKAQGSMDKAAKDSKNPHFKSSYADISAVIDACQKHLSENGISFSSSVLPVGTNFYLIGSLMHVSGEWLRTYIPLLMGKNDMQSLGSATTYARRQALTSLCNIATEDDDGKKASEEPRKPTKEIVFASKEEVETIRAMIEDISTLDEDFSESKVLQACGIKSLEEIHQSSLPSLVKNLQKKLEILHEKSSAV